LGSISPAMMFTAAPVEGLATGNDFAQLNYATGSSRKPRVEGQPPQNSSERRSPSTSHPDLVRAGQHRSPRTQCQFRRAAQHATRWPPGSITYRTGFSGPNSPTCWSRSPGSDSTPVTRLYRSMAREPSAMNSTSQRQPGTDTSTMIESGSECASLQWIPVPNQDDSERRGALRSWTLVTLREALVLGPDHARHPASRSAPIRHIGASRAGAMAG